MSGLVDPATVARLRAVIAEDRTRAAARLAGLTSDFDAIVAAADASNADDEHDPEGQTIGFERAQVSTLLAEATARLRALDRASVRLDTGGFGRCTRCGGAVALERLEVAPTTELCFACAAAAADRARRPGRTGRAGRR